MECGCFELRKQTMSTSGLWPLPPKRWVLPLTHGDEVGVLKDVEAAGMISNSAGVQAAGGMDK